MLQSNPPEVTIMSVEQPALQPRSAIQDLELKLSFSEFACDEVYETLWNRVIRVCDQYYPPRREESTS